MIPILNPGDYIDTNDDGEKKKVTLMITDICGGCPGTGDIDTTETAFQTVAPLSVGRLHGVTWDFDVKVD